MKRCGESRGQTWWCRIILKYDFETGTSSFVVELLLESKVFLGFPGAQYFIYSNSAAVTKEMLCIPVMEHNDYWPRNISCSVCLFRRYFEKSIRKACRCCLYLSFLSLKVNQATSKPGWRKEMTYWKQWSLSKASSPRCRHRYRKIQP